MPKAVYPGSLDPITNGHISAIKDTAEAFGGAIVAIGINPAKNYMFSLAEREELARRATAHIPGVTVTSFSGLMVNFLVRNDLNIVVRGVRNGQDLDDAMLQENLGWQQTLADQIKAFYVPARPGQTFVSSTALKAVLKEQGDATHMAPLPTIHATQARMLGQYFYGVTGMSGSGKSTVCRKFLEIAKARNIPAIHVDMDKYGHAILDSRHENDPLYVKTREQIKRTFGPAILDENGEIARKKLGEIVFADPEKLKQLNAIMHEPIFFRMNENLRGRKGLFLVDTALLVETDRTSMVNNNILLVKADEQELADRLAKRDGLSPEQVQRRLSSVFTTAAKIEKIDQSIAKNHYGTLAQLDSKNLSVDAEVEKAFDAMLEKIDIYGELRMTGFLKTVGVDNADAVYAQIRKLYAGNDRFYHTLSRVVDGLNQLPELLPHVQNKEAFTLAWIFKDCAFDSHAQDNVQRSALEMERVCKTAGIDAALVFHAKRIMTHADAGRDAKLLQDLGMLTLGKPVTQHAQDEQNLRREYNWMSAREWAEHHAQELTQGRFQTPYFQDKYGKKAERNIKRAVTALQF